MPKGVYPRTEFHREINRQGHLGHKVSEETKKKTSRALKGKKRPPFSEEWKDKIGKGSAKTWLGKKRSDYVKKRISETHKGELNFWWKGGVSKTNKPLSDNIRALTKYKNWRRGVFERDGYSCVECGYDKGKRIQAHHVKTLYSLIKKHSITLAEETVDIPCFWDIDNGITLCVDCHKLKHSRSSSCREVVLLMV